MSQCACSVYAGLRFPPEIISHSVWLYFRFPLSRRTVQEMLATRGIVVSHETVRQWAPKFGQDLLGIPDRIAESHRFCGEPKTLLHEF
jgi:putative transposase